MYVSDYGYATDFTKCSKVPVLYDTSTNSSGCKTNNWLFNGSTNQLSITPRTSSYGLVWIVIRSGRVSNTMNATATDVWPALYLNPELTIESGREGTSTNPYRISIS